MNMQFFVGKGNELFYVENIKGQKSDVQVFKLASLNFVVSLSFYS